MSDAPSAVSLCPFCKQEVAYGVTGLGSHLLEYCNALNRESGAGGRQRRALHLRGEAGNVTAAAPACPPAILDSAPGNGGLGVWVLVAEDAETCTYQYAGGIA
jgi:hypothetical protein